MSEEIHHQHVEEDALATRLSPAEVIAGKERFKNDPEAGRRVSLHIATIMANHRIEAAKQPHGFWVAEDRAFAADPEAQQKFIDAFGGIWNKTLQTAILLPGSEWPKDVTPPEAWIDVLDELEGTNHG